jgi:hypothetical protein
MNKWGIPTNIEEQVIERDKKCVYCGVEFSDSTRTVKASWEHIINDIRITTAENIARCCIGCNASKGSKSLKDWLKSKYCQSKNINQETVSEVIRIHIKKYWE